MKFKLPSFILDAYGPKGMFPDFQRNVLWARGYGAGSNIHLDGAVSNYITINLYLKFCQSDLSAFWRQTRDCSLRDRSSPYLQLHHWILTHFVSSCLRNIIYAYQFSLVFYTITFESSQERFIRFFWPWRKRKGLLGLLVFWRLGGLGFFVWLFLVLFVFF